MARSAGQPERPIGELMHVHRAAELLCCHRNTVYGLIQEGKIEAVRLGVRGLRVVKDSLVSYLQRNRVDPEEYFK